MKYKPGDKVRIKSLDWYNSNKDETGRVMCDYIGFCKEMTKYCGKVLTIMTIGNQDIGSKQKYFMHETDYAWGFTDDTIEGLALEKGSELPSVVYIPYIIEDSPPLETSTEMCPKIEVPTRYYCEVKHEPKMVSLDKVCDTLYDMLHNQCINDHAMVGTWAYENMVDFVKDFLQKLEE